MTDELLDTYRKLAHSGLSAAEYYVELRCNGVSKADVFMLLRDELGLSLPECTEILRQNEGSVERKKKNE